ncbi:alpha-D-xyloside xylohydrolase [Actinomyces ruminicola]|uniref:alpha-D-xyloside xylohydrolase n=1 Tax=Actinomyces ruminicola TaxID=332524 RepID=A0A1H0BGQ1_9ACTO|nr:alpha-xylosidase [Actinomyces ruminicola]SDN44819.1 alpha-D-xyloside xylohydrolase [Actinomyces ruminicola]
MKFSNGYWLDRPGYTVEKARGLLDLSVDAAGAASTVSAYAPVRPVSTRGDTLNVALLSASFTAVADGVIKVELVNHRGVRDRGPHFAVTTPEGYRGEVEQAPGAVVLRAGALAVTLREGEDWTAEFSSAGRPLTASLPRAVAHVVGPDGTSYMREQLSLRPGERVYGLGERFGAFTKNGQSVDIWNEDGGTASEQAYKNIPFYLTSAGYGVFVAEAGGVSFEVGSEVTTRVQFSVEGERLTYYVIDGPTPKDVLRRYTALTGRAPLVPTWSFGLWLTTSFTTDYDEQTVMSFIDGMERRDLPLSVFHFDTFWMRGFHWCDFVWDPATFPDPAGMLERIMARGLRVCVWINPYIAQRSALFAEGASRGYLVRTTAGDVWQTDLWQAGMALVDFTNPDAVAWYRGKLQALLDMGVDCFKTDFGERIPVRGIAWHDGSDPEKMHNYYTQLYNRTVFELLREQRGEGEAVLFARSATAGGQQFPVHWGGDNESTYASMGETLRGGLSLCSSGFAYWSHDIGGFEGTPDPGVFKRWLAFGLLSSHARLHGSNSVRVPWAFDEEAVDIARRFIRLRLSLMPYLYRLAAQAQATGVPMMRPMFLEFPDDPGARDVDTQYMLGDALLVAPVMDADGAAEVYLPEGTWTSWWDGTTVEGPRWVRERHDLDTLPLYVRQGSVLPVTGRVDRPEEDWAADLTLRCFGLVDGDEREVLVPAHDGCAAVTFHVARHDGVITARADGARGSWALEADGRSVWADDDSTVTLELTGSVTPSRVSAAPRG